MRNPFHPSPGPEQVLRPADRHRLPDSLADIPVETFTGADVEALRDRVSWIAQQYAPQAATLQVRQVQSVFGGSQPPPQVITAAYDHSGKRINRGVVSDGMHAIADATRPGRNWSLTLTDQRFLVAPPKPLDRAWGSAVKIAVTTEQVRASAWAGRRPDDAPPTLREAALRLSADEHRQRGHDPATWLRQQMLEAMAHELRHARFVDDGEIVTYNALSVVQPLLEETRFQAVVHDESGCPCYHDGLAPSASFGVGSGYVEQIAVISALVYASLGESITAAVDTAIALSHATEAYHRYHYPAPGFPQPLALTHPDDAVAQASSDALRDHDPYSDFNIRKADGRIHMGPTPDTHDQAPIDPDLVYREPTSAPRTRRAQPATSPAPHAPSPAVTAESAARPRRGR